MWLRCGRVEIHTKYILFGGETGEIPHQLRAWTILPEDPDSINKTHLAA